MAVIPPKRPAHAVWSKNWNCRKDGELSIPVVASPGGAGYDFWANQSRIGWRGGRMDWARILAYVTGMVDQELLARNEYLAAENRILKAQLKGRPPGLRCVWTIPAGWRKPTARRGRYSDCIASVCPADDDEIGDRWSD